MRLSSPLSIDNLMSLQGFYHPLLTRRKVPLVHPPSLNTFLPLFDQPALIVLRSHQMKPPLKEGQGVIDHMHLKVFNTQFVPLGSNMRE
jgi:hypothetical protein